MDCLECGGPTMDERWGRWCTPCGGVFTKKGQLMFRHVATVRGSRGISPIVYDLSTSDYAYMLLGNGKAPTTVRCPSCNHEFDVLARKAGKDLDGFKSPPVQVIHGSLDGVIALAFPDVRVEGEMPSLHPAPSATLWERRLLEA